MRRVASLLVLAGSISVAGALEARGQTVSVGPVDDQRELDAAALAELSREVMVNPDGSTTYSDLTVNGESWRVVIASLTLGSALGLGPTKVDAIVGVNNFFFASQVLTFNFNVPTAMSGSIGAGASASMLLTDANLDAKGSLTRDADTIPVELTVDSSPTGVAVLENLSLITAFGGQTRSMDGSVGLPGNGAAIPTPTTSFGIRLHFVLSGGDSAAVVASAIADQIGTLSLQGSPSASASVADSFEELPPREIQLDLADPPSPQGAAADPIRVVSGITAVRNLAAVTQNFTLVFTNPVLALSVSARRTPSRTTS